MAAVPTRNGPGAAFALRRTGAADGFFGSSARVFLCRGRRTVLRETVRYFAQLRAAGIPAELDIYHTDLHAFDMMRPRDAQSVAAAEAFERQFADARARYFAPQENTV